MENQVVEWCMGQGSAPNVGMPLKQVMVHVQGTGRDGGQRIAHNFNEIAHETLPGKLETVLAGETGDVVPLGVELSVMLL